MTVRIEAPVQYRHWTGRPARHRHADQLEQGWAYPTLDYDSATGRAVLTIDDYQAGAWTHLGFAPRPRSRWARFWRHWHHGRLMGYPRLSVLAFCLHGLTLTPDRARASRRHTAAV